MEEMKLEPWLIPRGLLIIPASLFAPNGGAFEKYWEIEGFISLVDTTKQRSLRRFGQLSSPPFTASNCDSIDLAMEVQLTPRGNANQTDILLTCNSAISTRTSIHFAVEIQGDRKRLLKSSEITLEASNRRQTTNYTVFHIPHSELLIRPADLLVGGQNLVLFCKGEIIHHRPSIIVPALNEMLLNRIADVKLVFPGQGHLYAHKLVLTYRSPVFEAMFLLDTVESEENVVQIVDISRKVFSEVLVYLYTEQVANLYDYAEEILIVADKYAILDLKAIAEEWLCNMMTTEKAEYWQQFAEHYSAKQLAAKACQLIEEAKKDEEDEAMFNIEFMMAKGVSKTTTGNTKLSWPAKNGKQLHWLKVLDSAKMIFVLLMERSKGFGGSGKDKSSIVDGESKKKKKKQSWWNEMLKESKVDRGTAQWTALEIGDQ